MKTRPKNKVIVVLYILLLLAPFAVSDEFTDPFIVPKQFFVLLAGGMLTFACLIFYFFKKYKLNYTIASIDIWLAVFIGYLTVHTGLAGAISLTDPQMLIWGMHGAVYFLARPFFVVEEKEGGTPFKWLLNSTLLILLIQALYGLAQTIDLFESIQDEFKVVGSFGNPGPYANYLVILLPVALGYLLYYHHRHNKIHYLSLTASLAVLLVLPFTEARTSWITTVAIIGFMLNYRFGLTQKVVFGLRTFLIRVLLMVSVVALLIFVAVFLYQYKQDSASGRLFIWEVTIDMIKDKPIFGHGFTKFPPVHNDYQAIYFKENPDDWQRAELADNINYAFNEYLQLAAETGMIGLLLFLGILFYVIRVPVSSEDLRKRYWILTAKTMVGAVVVTSLFSYPLHSPPSITLFFTALMVLSANSNASVRTFSTKAKKRQILGAMGIIMLGWFIIFQTKRLKGEIEWKNTFQQLKSGHVEQAFKKYESLYPVMSYSQFFMFNYGAELSVAERYEESLRILKEVRPRLNDADYHIYLGNTYAGLGRYKEAIQSFKKASLIMPVKFYPKYRLAKLYIELNDHPTARKMAEAIVDMPVKVPSEVVTNIKQEMQDYLNWLAHQQIENR